MPPVSSERRGPTGRRAGCKRDIVEVVREAGRPLTFKEVVRALRGAGRGHGKGTVMKALAELTAAGELVNHKDKRGYRLPEWRRDDTPSLF
jgi:Fe2+ or Zn2+ uptake regulation protein